MTGKDVVVATSKFLKRSMTKMGERIGWSQGQISQRMIRDSIRANELFQLLDANGVDVKFFVRSNGEEIRICRRGHGWHLRGSSDGVRYDTEHADAVANNFFADGVNEFGPDGRALELYKDCEGRYFFAEYTKNEGERSRVKGTPKDVALAFIEKWGEEVDKGPK